MTSHSYSSVTRLDASSFARRCPVSRFLPRLAFSWLLRTDLHGRRASSPATGCIRCSPATRDNCFPTRHSWQRYRFLKVWCGCMQVRRATAGACRLFGTNRTMECSPFRDDVVTVPYAGARPRASHVHHELAGGSARYHVDRGLARRVARQRIRFQNTTPSCSNDGVKFRCR
jgi:hypothetical protein